MNAADVSAVLVTRGNVSLNPIMQSLPFSDVVVWDNSARADLAVYGRYAAIAEAKHPVVFVQDDDCVLAPEAFIELLDAYEPGKLTANMPERFRPHYPDSCLVGFGAIFDRDLPVEAEARFQAANYTIDLRHFYRTADVIFTALTPRVLVDAPYTDLPWATGDDRMYRQPGHVGERARMLDLVRRVRAGRRRDAA